MKVTAINKLIKSIILPSSFGYEVQRDLMFKIESENFIKGYDFESTGNGEYDLAVWCFVQPLFVKSSTIYYNFGKRLRYKKRKSFLSSQYLEWWDASKENQEESFKSILEAINSEGERYLNEVVSASDFFEKFNSKIGADIRIYEAVSYTTILMANEATQNKYLEGLIRECGKPGNRESKWIVQIAADASQLRQSTFSKRREILENWKEETLKSLNLY